jgi:2-oxoglutarate ferredoxin oxidoreductase subunit beta
MSIEDIIKPENLVYQKSKLLTEKPSPHCPGCGHGKTHRIIALFS